MDQTIQQSIEILSQTQKKMNEALEVMKKQSSDLKRDIKSSPGSVRRKIRKKKIQVINNPPKGEEEGEEKVAKKISKNRKVARRKKKVLLYRKNIPERNFGDIRVTESMNMISCQKMGLTSFKYLDQFRDLKTLYLQRNHFTNFLHFPELQRLEIIHLENNEILSFLGFPELRNLKKIFLDKNPITLHPRYRIMTLLAVGNNLKEIDDEKVHSVERELIREFTYDHPEATACIKLGWHIDFGQKEFHDLVDELTNNAVQFLAHRNKIHESIQYVSLKNKKFVDDNEAVEDYLLTRKTKIITSSNSPTKEQRIIQHRLKRSRLKGSLSPPSARKKGSPNKVKEDEEVDVKGKFEIIKTNEEEQVEENKGEDEENEEEKDVEEDSEKDEEDAEVAKEEVKKEVERNLEDELDES